jgi:Mrp family chromosome partitioning ATPase
MSKNFELLQRAGWRQDYFEGLPGATTPSPEPAPAREAAPRKKAPALANDPVSNLVRKVFWESRTGPSRVVAFAGVSRGTGCTWTCVQAAKTLANHVDGKVCLVDANFEAPAIHQLYSGQPSPGVSDAIFEAKAAKSYAVRVGDGNLWYLPAGNQCKRIPTLPESSMLQSQLRELARDFEYVLLDSPALTSGALAAAVCKSGDGAVLVMEPSAITTAALARGRSLLASARVQLFGVVLNQRVPTLPPVLDRLMR